LELLKLPPDLIEEPPRAGALGRQQAAPVVQALLGTAGDGA
jgi:hypothetical protein